jgi:hypothetical protein
MTVPAVNQEENKDSIKVRGLKERAREVEGEGERERGLDPIATFVA